MNHLHLSIVSAAAPDKCPVCDVASPDIAGRGLHYGHWQGSAVGADLRPGESRDGHVSSHLLAAGQLQLPARRLRQSRRSADRQAGHLPAHHLGPVTQHHLPRNGQSQEHPLAAL